MPTEPQDRLVRKEVSLGAIRELPQQEDHIGLRSIAPFLDVETDDVIFEFLRGGLSAGLAPARAEDAEAELAQKDELLYGEGRASVIDWSLKDRYTASDVTRYREDQRLRRLAEGSVSAGAPGYVFVGRTEADFQRRLARHDALRRRKLDNRLEWLIMTSIENGSISYNDGKIKFSVDWKRPAAQSNQTPTALWSDYVNSDPIGNLIDWCQVVYNNVGVRPTRGIISERILNELWRNEKFRYAMGQPILPGAPSPAVDLRYGIGGANYTRSTALQILQQATGVSFTIYDSVYRTRAIGSQTFVNNRFMSDHKLVLMPALGETNAGEGMNDSLGVQAYGLSDIDDTEIGFAKTLTSPHPEGNWSSGYYEWEMENRDPWQHVRGTGIKAFPVFPYMDFTFQANVLAPA